jgi:hypothetical protein
MITKEDKAFLDYVKAHKHVGYGRMMQIISYAWYTSSEDMDEGALVVTGCVAFLDEGDRRSYLEGLRQEIAQGMPY